MTKKKKVTERHERQKGERTRERKELMRERQRIVDDSERERINGTQKRKPESKGAK